MGASPISATIDKIAAPRAAHLIAHLEAMIENEDGGFHWTDTDVETLEFALSNVVRLRSMRPTLERLAREAVL